MQDLSNLWTQDHRRLAGLFAIKYQYIGNKTCKKWKSHRNAACFHLHLTIFVGLPILKVFDTNNPS